MKLFSTTNIRNMSNTVRIVKGDGSDIVLNGKGCQDCSPAYGIEFDDSEEERLKEWINQPLASGCVMLSEKDFNCLGRGGIVHAGNLRIVLTNVSREFMEREAALAEACQE